MYLGSTAIGKAYLGEDLVFDASGGGTTPVLPYDAQVEYLQSSGTQYIDTRISPSTNFECEIKAVLTEEQAGYDTLLGSFTSSSAYGIALAFRASKNTLGAKGAGYIQFGNDTPPSLAVSSIATPLTEHVYKTSCKNNTIAIDVDGTYASKTHSNTSPSLLSMYMFARHRQDTGVGNYAKAKIYYCKIWNGGNLVFDAIPVRVGTTGYMYDNVSGQLLGNSGSGTFILGNDKS